MEKGRFFLSSLCVTLACFGVLMAFFSGCFNVRLHLPEVPKPEGFTFLSPANNQIDVDLDEPLVWNPSRYANEYKVYLDLQPPSSQKRGRQSWVTDEHLIPPEKIKLEPSNTYYWWVVARNFKGDETPGNQGGYWSFTTAPHKEDPGPAPFMLLYPEDRSDSIPLSLMLKWEESEGAIEYEVYIGKTPGFSDPITRTQTTEWKVEGLEYSTIYYWKVIAFNADGMQKASGGEVFQFLTKGWEPGEIPGDFSTAHPFQNASGLANKVDFRWSESAGAQRYRLEIDPDPTFLLSFQTETIETALSVEVLPGKSYYWRVTAMNAWGERGANGGEAFSFTTAEDEEEPVPEPGAFELELPLDNAANVPTQPDFHWSSSDFAENYVLYLSVDPQFSSDPISIETTTYRPVLPLADNTRYYWNVKAQNAQGERWAHDTPYSFVTIDQAKPEHPEAFRLYYPIDQQEDVPRILHLRWHASGNAQGYRVYFGTDPNPPLHGASIGHFYYPGLLQPSTLYYWKVTAFNEDGETEGSGGAVFSFLSSDQPPTHYPDVAGIWQIHMEVTGHLETTFSTDLIIEQEYASLSSSVRIEGSDIPLAGIIDTSGRIVFIGRHSGMKVHVQLTGTIEDLDSPNAIRDGVLAAYHGIAGKVAQGFWVAEKKSDGYSGW